MTSIGEQAREAASRSKTPEQEIPEISADEKSQNKEGRDPKADSENERKAGPKKAPIRQHVTGVANAALNNPVVRRNTSANPTADLVHEIKGGSQLPIAAGEADLTEKDTVNAFSKVAKYAIGLQVGAVATGARHEHEATMKGNQPREDDAPAVEKSGFMEHLKQLKTSFDTGVAESSSSKPPPAPAPAPAVRRRDDGYER